MTTQKNACAPLPAAASRNKRRPGRKNHAQQKSAAAAALAGLTGAAFAQDAYNVGLTGALTGPAAGTYAPAVDGLRIYIDKVNAAGGVNGKEKINLILLDDSAQPAKAAANATRLVTDDKVVLLLNASLSSTYGADHGGIAERTSR